MAEAAADFEYRTPAAEPTLKPPPAPTDAEIRAFELEADEEWEEWWEGLSKDQQRELVQSSKGMFGIAPQEGPQEEAYFSAADVVGYGGAAGGGKSALLALLALGPHQKTVIYRSDKQQMRGLVADVVEFYGTETGLNRQEGIFRFADRPGHILEWGGLGNPGDEQKWRGRPHDLLCIDEATEIRRDKFEFLKTWNRTTSPGQRTRIVMTFNPPGGPDDKDGAIGRWVIDYFAPWLDERVPEEERALPGEVRFFVKNEKGKEIQVPNKDPYILEIGGKRIPVIPESRTFIPAQVFDNKFLMQDGQYVSRLANLDEPFRSMMLLGQFRSGIVDADYQIIPTEWVDLAMERWDRECNVPGFVYPQMEALGIDVARGGRHNTIYAPRHGWTWGKLFRLEGTDTKTGEEAGEPALRMVRGRGDVDICVDALGPGASCFDYINGKATGAVAVLSQGGAHELQYYEDHWLFKNMRIALWWLMRKILDPANGLEPRLPKDDRLRSELISVRYMTAGREMKAEDKGDVEKRMGWHPDDADAVVYSIRTLAKTWGAERLKSAASAEVVAQRVAQAKRAHQQRAHRRMERLQAAGRRRGRGGGGWMRR